MTNTKEELIKLESTDDSNHIITKILSKQIIKRIPVLGDIIVDIYEEYNNTIYEEKIRTFLKSIYDQLEKIEDSKIDKDYINTDEYKYIISEIVSKIKYEYRFEKVKLFKNIIIKSSLIETKEINKTYILDKLDLITPIHFEILSWYIENKELKSDNDDSEYIIHKHKDLPPITPLYSSYENDLLTIGLLKNDNFGRVASKYTFYKISDLGTIFYYFIKFDDLY
jgi:hypothetical protein